MELVIKTAAQLAEMIRKREVSSVEVLDAYLQQIQKHNPKLNAVVTLDEAGARRRALEADEALARGEVWGPLHGVPVTIKDSFETAGLRSTSGCKALADYIPKQDADVVARLRKAGAIIMGKTNLPTLARGCQANNAVFGRSNNPWNLECTPGGSTGGGAAAVAAGLSPLETGSDIGGSIRLPAHFCGIYGLKATGGRIFGRGHISTEKQITNPRPPALPPGWEALWQLPVFGPLARSVGDLQLALQVMAEPSSPPLEKSPNKPLAELRIAWTEDFGSMPVDKDTQETIRQLAAKLEAAGCQLKQIPDAVDYNELWEVTGACIGAIDTIMQPPHVRLLRRLAGQLTSAKRIANPVMRGMMIGIRLDPKQMSSILARRQAMIDRIESFLGQWDVWVMPVFPIPAFTHRRDSEALSINGQKISQVIACTAFNTVFNMTGHPVVSMPVGHSREGLPIGVQIVGKRWGEMALLDAAEKIDGVIQEYKRPTGY